MNINDKYQKQLTLQDRYVIEDGLNHGEGIASIARILGKDITTISREVRKHRIGDKGFSVHHNDCRYRLYCQKQSLCKECTKVKKCCFCKIVDCRMLCPDYHSDLCKNTLRAPHVCNGCNDIYECRKPHFYYRANVAYDAYKVVQKESRTGIGFSRQDIYELDCLITPLSSLNFSRSFNLSKSVTQELPILSVINPASSILANASHLLCVIPFVLLLKRSG